MKALTKRFGERLALDDVSFAVGQREVFGYLGPNGSGKTTTMRLLLGLLKPTSGEALLFGQRASDSADARRRVGVLLETDGLYPRLSAYDNLDYFGRLYGVGELHTRIMQLLDFAGLEERAHDSVGTFSRGMRRKLGLVRALLHSPDMLLLDEPSAGLDPESQKMVRDLILSLSEQAGLTVFLSSHDLDEVQRLCGRVAVLQKGKLRVCDTLKALQLPTRPNQVELVLADRTRTADAVAALKGLDDAGEVSVDADTIRVSTKDSKGFARITAALEDAGISVEEMRRSRRSLEDVYLEIVKQETTHE
ncbi:ATP-binding cassette domain-containing protein [Chloroflexota bacterium]